MRKFLGGRGRSGFFGGTFWERLGCVAFGSGFYTFHLGGLNFLSTNSQKVIPQWPKWDEIFLSPFKLCLERVYIIFVILRILLLFDIKIAPWATILAGFMEIGLCILWANDQISWQKDMKSRNQRFKFNKEIHSDEIKIFKIIIFITILLILTHKAVKSPFLNIFGATLLVHTRASHFWFVHRIMHPWRISWLPDIGKVN